MTIQHNLDTTAFRKKRVPWLILMLLPSLIVDAIIIFRVVTLHSVVLDSMGRLAVQEILMLFLANALLFKSEGIILYFVMKSFRKSSVVRVSPTQVVYRRKRFVGYTFYYNYRIYIEYHITAPKTVTRRRNGSIDITGDMSVVYFSQDGQEVHSKGTKRRCVIPGFYQDMGGILQQLEHFKENS